MANIYKNAKLDLTTNTVTTLYTCPSNSRAILKSMYVCDDSNNGSTITVKLYIKLNPRLKQLLYFKHNIVITHLLH